MTTIKPGMRAIYLEAASDDFTTAQQAAFCEGYDVIEHLQALDYPTVQIAKGLFDAAIVGFSQSGLTWREIAEILIAEAKRQINRTDPPVTAGLRKMEDAE
jgi:hypothetical protein